MKYDRSFFSFPFREILSFLLIILVSFCSCNDLSDTNQQLTNQAKNESITLEKFTETISQAGLEERAPLLVSSDFGRSWQDAAPDLPRAMEITFLAQKGKELVIASDNFGVYVSKEKRTKWEALNEGLPNLKINALLVDQNKIYIGVYQAGLFRLDDPTIGWVPMNQSLPDPRIQAIHKSNGRLYIGTDFGLFFQEEESNEWTATNLTTQTLSIFESAGKMIAGTSSGTAISENQGNIWTWIREQGAVHYTLLNNDRIIELAINGDLVYSDDWGATWRMINYGKNGGSYVYDLLDLGEQHLLSNNYGIRLSNDRGETWELVYPTETMAFFELIVDGNQIYGGTRNWDEFRGR